MNFKAFLDRTRRTNTVNQILKHQLLWMMLLRVILYTLLLGLSYIFGNASLDVILMPGDLLILLLFTVYLTTISSAFYLFASEGNLRKFGFIQNLLDTFFATLLVYYTGISHSIFTSIYFFPIIAGGLILPRKGGLVAAAASTLLYGLILMLEVFGSYPTSLLEMGYRGADDPMVSLNHFSVQGLTFFLAAILSALFSLRIRTTEDALSDSLRNFDRLAVLYKQIFDNIATGIITVDSENIITSANNATAEITGYTPRALVGSQLTAHFPELNLQAPRMRQSADFTRHDGKHIRLGYSHMDLQQPGETSPDTLDQHKIITLRDISEIEQLERQMRQAEKLAAIGMMSAGIAHDFRNPLTAISGSAQVLANEFSQEGSENLFNYELADIILRESNRMIDTISDFLKFSRPEAANREWFSLRSCLNEVVQVCQADPAWPLSTRIEVLFDETIDIWADQRQMFTVLNHLIQNGMAFCPPGRELIEVEAEEVKHGDAGDTISISVSDNGQGVPRDDREKVFEPFFTSRADGTGLGLAIVKQIIEEHGGTIHIDSSSSGGAKFIVDLPLPS
jgi:two-component system sensor histidine kinase PilS (NtrC family)